MFFYYISKDVNKSSTGVRLILLKFIPNHLDIHYNNVDIIITMEEDEYTTKINERKEKSILPLIEDVADWLNTYLEVPIK